MFDLTYASTEALLSGLLATCDETATIAQRLAARAREESLRTLLQERAASYRSAARELRRNGGTLGVETEAADPIDGVGELACVEPVWEAIECSALICFRDALDGELPPELQPVVRRWIADGVSALERLRATRPA